MHAVAVVARQLSDRRRSGRVGARTPRVRPISSSPASTAGSPPPCPGRASRRRGGAALGRPGARRRRRATSSCVSDGRCSRRVRVALLDLAGHRLRCREGRTRRRAAAAFQVRGSSSSASGLPWLSVTIWSQTAASSGPCTLSSSRARASPSSSPRMRSSGSPARTSSPMPVRAAHTSAIRSASRRRATNAEDLRRGLVEPLRVVDDAEQRLLLGDLGEQASAWRARPGSGRARARRCRPNTVASASRCGAGSRSSVIEHRARRADAGRRTRAPSRTRRLPLRTMRQSDALATRCSSNAECRPPPRHARRAPDSGPPAGSPAGDRRRDIRCADHEEAAQRRHSISRTPRSPLQASDCTRRFL